MPRWDLPDAFCCSFLRKHRNSLYSWRHLLWPAEKATLARNPVAVQHLERQWVLMLAVCWLHGRTCCQLQVSDTNVYQAAQTGYSHKDGYLKTAPHLALLHLASLSMESAWSMEAQNRVMHKVSQADIHRKTGDMWHWMAGNRGQSNLYAMHWTGDGTVGHRNSFHQQISTSHRQLCS